MPRDCRLHILDIKNAIERIQEYTMSMSKEHFLTDYKTQDAVIRNLGIIGEAASKLSEDVKIASPEIEWRKIVALRNMLIREYFGVNNEIVWDVIKSKLDELLKFSNKL